MNATQKYPDDELTAKWSFSYAVTSLWNSLPDSRSTIRSDYRQFKNFQKTVKDILLSSYRFIDCWTLSLSLSLSLSFFLFLFTQTNRKCDIWRV